MADIYELYNRKVIIIGTGNKYGAYIACAFNIRIL